MMSPTIGVLNWLLSCVGLPPSAWVVEPQVGHRGAAAGRDLDVDADDDASSAWPALAALPGEPFESARVDGASSRQVFWHVTLAAPARDAGGGPRSSGPSTR